MSDTTHYWPSPDQPGLYSLDRNVGKPVSWEWTGSKWHLGFVSWSTADMLRIGYLGVRREVPADIPAAVPTPPVADEAAYPQWARDIVQAINEVREELAAIEKRLR